MRRVSLMVGVVGLLVMASVGEAVRPRGWVFATEKDFSKGSFEGTVVDSYGRLALGRELSAVATGKDSEIVTGLVDGKGGAVFAAVNGEEGAKVYRIEGKKGAEVYAAPKDFEITAMAEDGQGNLLVALSGKTARVVRVNASGGKEAAVFENEAVDYVWAIAVGKEGRVFVGTGPQGKVYQVADDKAGKEVLETPAKNVTALGFDKDDNLVAGTDGKGLVIRVDAKTGKGFVLLDAGKVDVNAIVRDKDGALFVATTKGEAQEKEDEEEPGTKSKPGATEPEPVDPGDGDGKAELKGKQGAAMRTVPGVFGVQDELAGTLKRLAEQAKGGPATKRKSGILHRQGSTTKHRAEDSKEQMGGGGEEGPVDASCVYRISADGVVTTVMQEGDMNYALALAGGDLLIGTGNEGKVYRYRAEDESVALVARVKQEHVTAILATKAGEVLLGTANMGQVYRLGAGVTKSGTFTSQVLDAGNTTNWGHWAGQVTAPEGSKVTVATRSGNTRSALGGSEKFWSQWSKESDLASGKIDGKVDSPAAKYLQFRVTLTGDRKSGGGASPVVNGLKLGYQAENLAPRIKKVAVETAGGGSEGDEGGDEERSKDLEAPPAVAQVSWEASDPNGDTLVYRVFYRGAGKVEGKEDVWTPLAKELKEPVYEWDTRGLADGGYQVKVIASDKLDNAAEEAREAARVSGTFVVDHTPPAIGELKVAVNGNKVTISGEAKDATSAVVDVRYRVDGQISAGGDWQPAAGSDKIFDSAQEAFTVVTSPLSVGGHRVTVRATDSQGNSAYKTVTVVVKP